MLRRLLPASLLLLLAALLAAPAAAQPLHLDLAAPPDLEAFALEDRAAWLGAPGGPRLAPTLRLEGQGGLGDHAAAWAGAFGAGGDLGWKAGDLLLLAARAELEIAALDGLEAADVASPEGGLRGTHRLELAFTPLRGGDGAAPLPAVAALLRLELDHAGARRPWLRPVHLGPAPYLDARAHLEVHLGREWGALIEADANLYSHDLGRGWLTPTTVVGAAIAPAIWGDSLAEPGFGNRLALLRAAFLQADQRASPIEADPDTWTSQLVDLRLFDLSMRERGADNAHGLFSTLHARVEAATGVAFGLDGEGWGIVGRMAGTVWSDLFSGGLGVSRYADLSPDGTRWLLVRRVEAHVGVGLPDDLQGRLTILGDQLQALGTNLPDDPLRFGAQLQGDLPLGAGWSLGAEVRALYDTNQRAWTPAPGAGWNGQGSLLIRWAPATPPAP